MANDIKVNLTLTGEHETSRGLKAVGTSAERAGDDLQEMARDAGFLDKRIVELRGEIKALITEFNRTGDMDLMKKINAGNRDLGRFDRLKKQLASLAEDGAETGTALTKSIAAAMARGGPWVAAGATTLGASITPLIGAAAAAGVIGAVGTGGIIGGIAAAAQDPRVQESAKELGAQFSQGVTLLGEPFVGSTLAALDKLADGMDEKISMLREGLSSIAPIVGPLTDGLDGLVDEMLPGITKGLEGAKPVLRALATELPPIGRSIGNFIEDISEDTDGAIAAISALSRGLQATAGFAAGTISSLSETYEWIVRNGEAMSGLTDSLLGWHPLAGPWIKSANEGFREQVGAIEAAKNASGDLRNTTETLTTTYHSFGGALGESIRKLEQQREAMLKVVDSSLGLRRSTMDIEEAIDSFSKSVAENGKSLDITTEKGRRNVETIDAGIDALRRGAQAAYDNALANGATALEAEEAAKRYREKYIPALQTAAEKAGLNKDKVAELFAELKKLDGKVYTYTLVQRGGRTIGAQVPGGFIPNGFEGRASGGPVYPGQTYVVGENGPEVLQMGSTGGHVYNAQQTAAMRASAPTPEIVVQPQLNISLRLDNGYSHGHELEDLLMQMISKRLRIDGGNIGLFRIPRQEGCY